MGLIFTVMMTKTATYLKLHKNKIEKRSPHYYVYAWAWTILNLARSPRSVAIAARRRSAAILAPNSILQAADRASHYYRVHTTQCSRLPPPPIPFQPPPVATSPLSITAARHVRSSR